MYGMVMMAALTTGMDMPDFGRRRGGGCCGCYGGMGWGGGWGGGYGGCYGMGYGGWGGGCYGMGLGYGGWGGGGMGWGGWGGGYGYGGYVMGMPLNGGYAYSSPMYGFSYGTPVLASNTTILNPGTQSFFYNPGTMNRANKATLIVHLPSDANLTIEGKPTRSTSGTRTFFSPTLEPGKTYTYTLRAEVNRDGDIRDVERTVNVQAGRTSNVTLDFAKDKRNNDIEANDLSAPNDRQVAPTAPRRTQPNNVSPNSSRRTLPKPPSDR